MFGNFLLNNCEFEIANIIDWDEILSPTNLAERYNVKFTTVDEGFEFKPFSFISLRQEFLRLNLNPFNLPITCKRDFLLFNILDYNYLINNYSGVLDCRRFSLNSKPFWLMKHSQLINSRFLIQSEQKIKTLFCLLK